MDGAPTGEEPPRPDLVPLREATKAWFLISLQTFGGPAGQIAVMQRTLVDERRWIGQRRFLHALNYCMLLPGPEAQQLAVYTGWLLNGTRGGVIAGSLFVLPGLVALLALSVVYARFGSTTAVTSLFAGLAPAVIAIVLQAVIRVGRRALTGRALLAIAIGAFAALALFGIPFPIVIGLAALAGLVAARRSPSDAHDLPGDGPPPLVPDDALHHETPSWRRAARVAVVGIVLWLLPVAAVGALLGTHTTIFREGTFFSGTALITFGGAYAALSFVAQRAVESYGWLAPGEMARGLALAETTPGPLIMVVQFVAFLGAYRSPGDLNPWLAAVFASLLTTWVTFVPSFLFIFVGAPYVERLRGNRRLSAALTGVTAAVVGVIANLAAYFTVHTLFDRTRTVTSGPLHLVLPVIDSVRATPLVIAVVAAVLLLRVGWSVLRVLGLCAVLGLLAGLVGLPGT